MQKEFFWKLWCFNNVKQLIIKTKSMQNFICKIAGWRKGGTSACKIIETSSVPKM